MHANAQAHSTVFRDRTIEPGAVGLEVYRFCEFEVDLSRGVLRREGIAVDLTPKSVDVLVYLVRNRGRLVSRDELLRHAWPSVSVGKGSLTQAVWQVRRALGDCTVSPRFIHTQYACGYRFVGAAHG